MATGYDVEIVRDVDGLITDRIINSYIDGAPSKPRGKEIQFISSDLFENPLVVLDIDDNITIEDNAVQTNSNDDFRNIAVNNFVAYLATFGQNSNPTNLAALQGDGFFTVLLNNQFATYMAANPNAFTGDSLLAWRTTTSFTKDDPLDTANKIRNFAEEILHDLVVDWRGDAQTWLDI